MNSQGTRKGTLMCTLPWERHIAVELILSSVTENPSLPINCRGGGISVHTFLSGSEIGLILSLYMYYHCAICSFTCQQTQLPCTYINTLETEILSQTTMLLKSWPVFPFNSVKIIVLLSYCCCRAETSWESPLPWEKTPESSSLQAQSLVFNS